jgi:conjugal transfer/entry exclusion protein
VYLKDLPANSLSAEEREFMKTMAEIDAWYDAEMDKAERKGKLEGKLESATRAISVKFQGYAPSEQVTSQLAALNEQQLDDLIVGMFSWQTVAQMEEWLNSVDT